MQFGTLESFLIIICFTLITALICRFIRLPVIVGYLIVGSIIGPHALGWISSTEQIKHLAEFGVVLLMFTIGLEFSLSRLMKLRRSVFIVGALQVFFSILTTIGIGLLLKIALTPMIIIGSIVAMSSTAIVLKQLTDQLEINADYGLHAVGILLFQDLAVILLLVLVGALSKQPPQHLLPIITKALINGVIVIGIMLLIGRWLLRPIFHLITRTQQVELLSLATLLIVISAAWATQKLGLSYALGAFIAGIMLAESEYKHQISVEVRPFRDILLGLFFISIGMLVNIQVWPNTWPWIALIVIALMFGKSLLIFGVSVLARYPAKTAFQTSIILSQGGEFGFAILAIALTNKLLPNDWGQAILAGILICFVLSPIVIRFNKKITAFFFDEKAKSTLDDISQIQLSTSALHNHVVLCGFGRVGKKITHFLNRIKQPYVGIDINPSVIKSAKNNHCNVVFGDATHPEILKVMNIENAKAIVISFDHLSSTKTALQQLRMLSETTTIIVRCQRESERPLLEALGASYVITAMYEESLAVADYLLHTLAIPDTEIAQLIESDRKKHYQT